MAATSSGKSGSTLEGFWQYILSKRPKLVIWENSDKTKAADIDFLGKLLFQAGYISMHERLDANNYSPQVSVFHCPGP